MRTKIHEKIKLTVTKIAESAGATADVNIISRTPMTINDPSLTMKMIPSLKRAAGETNVKEINAETGAEDFGCYEEKVQGLFFYLGAKAPETDPLKVAHHTPDFIIDERGFITGVKAMLDLTTDYMFMKN